ncbi:hypothetical protein [Hymenobacter sp. B81]|uniref:hypothetical protein n=1 Tax=Hymenobacter sp. B81 TaxID=3344878 RepID=UPI0037DCBD2C
MEPTPLIKPPVGSLPRKTALLPDNDQQLADLAVFAANYWPTQSWLTLRYTTAAAFQQQATAYHAAVASRQRIGSARPIDADELLSLDAQIDEHLYRVKNRLIDQHGKRRAPAHYAAVGIIKYRGGYIIDRERSRRAAALQQLLQGLVSEDIADGDFGTAFWQPIATRYGQLVTQLTDTNGAVARAVGQKDAMREAVEQVLSSLAKVLEDNYPDKKAYRAELRAWGFQREMY